MLAVQLYALLLLFNPQVLLLLGQTLSLNLLLPVLLLRASLIELLGSTLNPLLLLLLPRAKFFLVLL